MRRDASGRRGRGVGSGVGFMGAAVCLSVCLSGGPGTAKFDERLPPATASSFYHHNRPSVLCAAVVKNTTPIVASASRHPASPLRLHPLPRDTATQKPVALHNRPPPPVVTARASADRRPLVSPRFASDSSRRVPSPALHCPARRRRPRHAWFCTAAHAAPPPRVSGTHGMHTARRHC